MDQIVGTSKHHAFAAINMSTGAEATMLTNPVCKYRILGAAVGAITTFAFTISGYSEMETFEILVPNTLATTIGESIEIFISAPEGKAHLIIDVVPDPSIFATASGLSSAVSPLATSASLATAQTNITAIKAITDLLTLANVRLQADNALTAYDSPAKTVTAFNSDIVEGTFTRRQVERIIAAVLAGTRANANNIDTFTGLDGATSRLVAAVSSSGRTVTTRNGD